MQSVADNADDQIAENISRLRKITADLLEPVLHYTIVRDGCHSLKDLFVKVSGLVEEESTNHRDIYTKSGKAIATSFAALCITDMVRTRSFLMGIQEALEDKLKLNPGKPVTVLYAGTGPFATLLTPLTTLFNPAQLQLVLVEINPQSISFLKRTIQQFAMEEYVVEVFEADAVEFEIPHNCMPDIVVSETMLQALRSEPQVMISANLMSQCSSNTLLIPETITVSAALINTSIELDNKIYPLIVLFEFRADMAANLRQGKAGLSIFNHGLLIEVPQDKVAAYVFLALLTEVQVYKKNLIQYNESGLTMPYLLLELQQIKEWPAVCRIMYKTGVEPGFIMLREESKIVSIPRKSEI